MTFMVRKAEIPKRVHSRLRRPLIADVARQAHAVAEPLDDSNNPVRIGGDRVVSHPQLIGSEAAGGGQNPGSPGKGRFDQPGAGRAPHVFDFQRQRETCDRSRRCRCGGGFRGRCREGRVVCGAWNEAALLAFPKKIAPTEGGGVGRAGSLQQDAEDLAAARAAEVTGPACKRTFDPLGAQGQPAEVAHPIGFGGFVGKCFGVRHDGQVKSLAQPQRFDEGDDTSSGRRSTWWSPAAAGARRGCRS